MYVEFLDGEKYAKHYADTADTPDAFEDAGYLLTEHDIVVDIDDLPKEVIEKMIVMFGIQTETVWTDRGVHFYFKKPASFTRGANRVCALGFPIELKHIGNTRAVTVKRNGILRTIENAGMREEMPPLFALNKRFENLMGYGEGDGRNNALFKHRSQLAGVAGWQNMVRFINLYIFDEPLPEKEITAITRDMAVVADKDNEPAVAEWLMTEYKMIKFNGVIYFKSGDEFITDDDKLIRLIFDKVGAKKTRYVEEVRKQIEYRAPVMKEPEQGFDIKFRNGILRAGRFIEIDYEDFTPYSIDVSYYPDAQPVEVVDEYIDHLTRSEEEYRKLLLECLGHTLIVDKEFKRMVGKFFIFVGGGGNGKGTLLQIIKKILNGKNCTALSIQNMKDERYFVTLNGKLANLGDDIQDEPIDNEAMKMLKNISTCDYVEGRRLYKESQSMQLTTTLIFTSNHVIKSFEKGKSYKRRVMWLPMFTEVEEDKKDPLFITRLTTQEALEYWTRLIVEGYLRLYSNHTFTVSPTVKNYNEQYHEENNTCLMWLEDMTPDEILYKRAPEVMEEYTIWAEEYGLNVGSSRMMKDAIWEKFKMGIGVRKNGSGKSERVYMLENETTQTLR